MCIRDRFERVCGQKGLRINPGKSKVLVFEEDETDEGMGLEIRVGGVVLEEVKVFRYLGMDDRYKKKLGVFEAKGLRAVCGVRKRERIRNRVLRERCDWKNGLVRRA